MKSGWKDCKNKFMTNNPKEEVEKLLNTIMPFAEQQLNKNKEFLPFVTVMLLTGEIQTVASGNEHSEAQKVIDDIQKRLIEGAKNGEYLATGIAYLSLVTDPETKEKKDAVCINLDHKDNYSVKLFYPYNYNLDSGTVYFSDPIGSVGDDKIFKYK